MYTKSDAVVQDHTAVEEPEVARSGPSAVAEPLLVQRERAVLSDLFQLIAERSTVEPKIDAEFKADVARLEEKFEIAYQDIIVRFATDKETTERLAQESRQRITQWTEAERAAAEEEFTETRTK